MWLNLYPKMNASFQERSGLNLLVSICALMTMAVLIAAELFALVRPEISDLVGIFKKTISAHIPLH